MSSFEKDGYWWLPDNPDERIAGKLIFGHDVRSELCLLGSFQNRIDALRMIGTCGKENRPKIILGIDESGINYTLYDCAQINCQISAFIKTAFSPSIVIKGSHFSRVEDLIFSSMTLKLPHLEDWYRISGKNTNIEHRDDKIRKITFTYQQPDALVVKFEDGRIEIGHDYRFNFARFSEDFEFSEKVCISIIPNESVDLFEFMDNWLPLAHNFIAICAGRPLSILEMRGTANNSQISASSATTELQFYWEKKKYGGEDKELFHHDMICTYPDIHSEFEEIFQKWVRTYRELKPIIQLFINEVLSREFFSSNSFINSVQASEAYHRYRRSGEEISPEEHKARITSIYESAPEEYKEWLDAKLKFSNEITLKKRIRELLRERADLFKICEKQIKRISFRIAEIRNLFAHYAGKGNMNFASFNELSTFDRLLQWTLSACLLEEMGLSRDKVNEVITRNQAFLYFREVTLGKRTMEIMKVETVKTEDLPEPIKKLTKKNDPS